VTSDRQTERRRLESIIARARWRIAGSADVNQREEESAEARSGEVML
jgi:hypothetical protein